MLSGPVAVEFLHLLMTSATASGVNGAKSGSSLCLSWIFLIIGLVFGSSERPGSGFWPGPGPGPGLAKMAGAGAGFGRGRV